MRACVRVCVRARARVYVCICVCACVYVCVCVLCIIMPLIERESLRSYLCVCILGCGCSVIESDFNYFYERTNEAKPTNIPCVLLPLLPQKAYDL